MDRAGRVAIEFTAVLGGLGLYAAALAIPDTVPPAVPVAGIGLVIASVAFTALLIELGIWIAPRSPYVVQMPFKRRRANRPSVKEQWAERGREITVAQAPQQTSVKPATSSGNPSLDMAPGRGMAMTAKLLLQLQAQEKEAEQYRDDSEGLGKAYKCPNCDFRSYSAIGSKAILEHVGSAHPKPAPKPPPLNAVDVTRHSRATSVGTITLHDVSDPAIDDSEFPILVGIDKGLRAPHRKDLCGRRDTLVTQARSYEKTIVMLVKPTVVEMQRWESLVTKWMVAIVRWAEAAGLGDLPTVRSAVDSYEASGGEMGPPKRQELLRSIRKGRAWLEHHRHSCGVP
jgi:hypothetical protein